MKISHWAAAVALLGGVGLQAEVPELLELVPEAKGYELIAKFNPLRWRADGYQVDRSEVLSGDLKRIGYLVKLTAKDGKTSWVFQNPIGVARRSVIDHVMLPYLAQGLPAPQAEARTPEYYRKRPCPDLVYDAAEILEDICIARGRLKAAEKSE